MEEIVIAILGSGVLSTVISGLFNIYNNHQKANSGINNGLKFLLCNEITTLATKHIQAGAITISDLKIIEDAWHCYHNQLGGNGFLDGIMSDVRNLPLK